MFRLWVQHLNLKPESDREDEEGSKDTLYHYIDHQQHQWELHLPLVEFVICNSC